MNQRMNTPWQSRCPPSGFVLHRDGKPLTESMFFAAWKRINAAIDLHGATEHVFRHTFATMAQPNLDPKTLQEIMGHSNFQTTMNIYAHFREDLIKSAGADMADMYEDNRA